MHIYMSAHICALASVMHSSVPDKLFELRLQVIHAAAVINDDYFFEQVHWCALED